MARLAALTRFGTGEARPKPTGSSYLPADLDSLHCVFHPGPMLLVNTQFIRPPELRKEERQTFLARVAGIGISGTLGQMTSAGVHGTPQLVEFGAGYGRECCRQGDLEEPARCSTALPGSAPLTLPTAFLFSASRWSCRTLSRVR